MNNGADIVNNGAGDGWRFWIVLLYSIWNNVSIQNAHIGQFFQH
jgi:hypothetical protein